MCNLLIRVNVYIRKRIPSKTKRYGKEKKIIQLDKARDGFDEHIMGHVYPGYILFCNGRKKRRIPFAARKRTDYLMVSRLAQTRKQKDINS